MAESSATEPPPETIEETLRNAFFFSGKGLSDEEIQKLKPFMELLDREIDRLAEEKRKSELDNRNSLRYNLAAQ